MSADAAFLQRAAAADELRRFAKLLRRRAAKAHAQNYGNYFLSGEETAYLAAARSLDRRADKLTGTSPINEGVQTKEQS